jgi:chromate transporter
VGVGSTDPLQHRGHLVDAPMTSEIGTLLTLAGYFALLSLFAIGGANAALPEMHRLAVEVMHWMSDRQFADMFAIAQVTPGPNVIVVTLIGYHVAGLMGALVATLAMCGPTCVFAFFVSRAWDRFKDAPWRMAIQAALVPVSIGLIGASAAVVASATAQSGVAVAVTALSAVVTYTVRVNPLWIFAGAALLGLGGLM